MHVRHASRVTAGKDGREAEIAGAVRFLHAAQVILRRHAARIQRIQAIAVAMPYIHGVAGQAGAAAAGVKQLQLNGERHARRHTRSAIETGADIAAHDARLLQHVDDAAAMRVRAIGRVRPARFLRYHRAGARGRYCNGARTAACRRIAGVRSAAATDQRQGGGAGQHPAQHLPPFSGLPAHHFEVGCQTVIM
ncbi:hypothetical protein D3C72_1543880 [compost metagenome]